MSEFQATEAGVSEDSGLEEALKEYDLVILRVFQKLHVAHEEAARLSFTKADVERAIHELGLAVRNVPDIVYIGDRKSLPSTWRPGGRTSG